MCGIAGAVARGVDNRSIVAAMTQVQRHRGPDADGLWADDTCALGHRRLAVIDLSERGCQPMADDTGHLHLTYNGEIYNFQELRRKLAALGHRCRSDSDTEVLLQAYRQWGLSALQQLRGMFAFALWDAQEQRLLLARDRVGKKPLFYAAVPGGISFSSEMQGVLADPRVGREVDWSAIDAYLSWGYIPAPATGFAGVRKLGPGSWLTVDLASGTPVLNEQRYWELSYEPKRRLSMHGAQTELREILTEAVRLRMLSDVPLGAFLSGGIDSSIVVGLMAELSSAPVKTFSIGFEEAGWSELEHAARIARLWRTDHHEYVVKADALSILPTLVQHYGEPYADSSAIPTYYVSEMARSQVTVALNGDGGDESFAGYDRYRGNAVAARVSRLPGSASAAGVLSRVLPDSADPKSVLRRARRFLEVANQPMPQRYARWAGYFSEDEKRRLYQGPLRPLLLRDRPLAWMEALFASTDALHPVDAAMAVDVRSYLPFDLLVKVDITSMAHSLEARSPFLDHEVMQFAASLPVPLKLRRGVAKRLLRETFTDMLPTENVNRRKMGFGVPVGEWFRGPLRPLLEESLLGADSRTAHYLDSRGTQALVRAHLERRVDGSSKLWSLVMLEEWHRQVVESSP
jgi:asparagine synthase (glutamine-hydrolysing)